MLNLQQNSKMNLTNPRNVCKLLTKFLPSDVFNFKKVTFFQFYPADLVNTKTTIPLRVGEQHKIYTSTLRVCMQLFRKRLSEKMCTRQPRKVIWDMINTTAAVEPTFVAFH